MISPQKKKKKKKKKKDIIILTVKHSGINMIFSCFSSSGTGALTYQKNNG